MLEEEEPFNKFNLQHKDAWFSFETELESFWEDEKHQYYDITYKSQTIIDILIQNPIFIIIIVLLCLWCIITYFEKKLLPKLKSKKKK